MAQLKKYAINLEVTRILFEGILSFDSLREWKKAV